MACSESGDGSCSVMLLGGAEPHSITGPTPANAPYLSSELAEILLDEAEIPDDPTIRFIYRADFFTFSWELQAPLIARLAEIGATIEFCVNRENCDPREFSINSTAVELRVFPDRDPDEITAMLGIAPTEMGRAGDPFRGNRVRAKNYWRLGREVEGQGDLDHLVWCLADDLPSNTKELLAGMRACVGTVLSVEYSDGGFALDAVTVDLLAHLGQPFGCWLYP